MYQKDLVRDAWKSAGLYDEDDPKLRQFLDLLEDPVHCWAELIAACRTEFAAYKARVVQPILASGDTLVHLMVIRAASEADELDLIERYITASDPAREEAELRAIALKRVPRLSDALSGKAGLTPGVRSMLTPPGPAPAAEPDSPPHPGPAAEPDSPPHPGPAADPGPPPAPAG